MNANWDKIKNVVDNNADELLGNNNIIEQSLQEIADIKAKNTQQDTNIQGNATNISTLQEDNITNKKDISDVNAEQEIQNTDIELLKQENIALKQENEELREDIEANIEAIELSSEEITALQEECERLRSDKKALAITGQAEGESIYIDDSSDARFESFEIYGNSKQDGEPTLDNRVEIKTVKDNINIKICNNLFKQNWKNITYNGNSSIRLSDYILNTSKGKKITFNTDLDLSVFDWAVNGTATTYPSSIIYNSSWLASLSHSYVNTNPNIEYFYIGIRKKDNSKITPEEIAEYSFDVNYDENTTLIPHEEQNYTIPVQQEMVDKEDYLDFENEEEVHGWNKIIWNGTENWALDTNNTNDTYISFRTSITDMINLSSHDDQLITDKIVNQYGGIGLNKEHLWVYGTNVEVAIKKERLDTLDATGFKNFLANNIISVYYKLATEKRLPFTEEQKTVAKQIKHTAHTYKTITNISSSDEVSPNIKVVYDKDLETVISSLTNAIVALGGGI